ncbi:MAG: hypothetical protein HYY04_13655 [Chloroflexi bacterium]|nr:hypothetical protein [Chloroflexota bacterium]
MNGKERVKRAVEFRRPDRVPARVSASSALWKVYRDDLRRVVEQYSWMQDFGWAPRGQVRAVDSYDDFRTIEQEGTYVDNWGCVWHNIHGGLAGQVFGHPLADWRGLQSLRPPDPEVQGEFGGPIDWQDISASIAANGQDRYLMGSGGRIWERMYWLRGMEALMMDIAEGRPEVQELIDLIVDHNIRHIKKWLELDIDCIVFSDDWGAQTQLLINPRDWRKYFKPAYAREFAVIKAAGKHTWFHSDGYILNIIPDLIEIGLDVVNPQIGANGLENLIAVCKGRICVDLDLDRQKELAFGTPAELKAHVRGAIEALRADAGGLVVKAEFNPPAPLANIEAAYEAFAECCGRPES